MRGVGGTADIFDKVKTTCRDLVRETKLGDTITLITFGETARAYPTIVLDSEAQRQRFFELIDDLEAEGNWTYTAEALRVSLQEAARLEGQFPEHTKYVLILTDGLNDPPPGARTDGITLRDAAKPYAGKPWYVYQVQYGQQLDEELAETLCEVFQNCKNVKDTGVVGGIDSIRREIRRPPSWAFEPSLLRLDLNEPETPIEGAIQITLPGDLSAASLRVSLVRNQIPQALRLDQALTNRQGGATLRLTANPSPGLPDGLYHGEVHVVLTDTTHYAAASHTIPLVITAATSPDVVVLRAEPTVISLSIDAYDEPVEATVQIAIPDALSATELEVDLARNNVPESLRLDHTLADTGAGSARLTVTATASEDLDVGFYQGAVRVRLVDSARYQAVPLTLPVVISAEREVIWRWEPRALSMALDAVDVPVEVSLQLQHLPDDLPTRAILVSWYPEDVPDAITVTHELVQRQGGAVVRVTATAQEEIENGTYEGILRLELAGATRYSAAPLEVPVTVRTVLVPPTWPYWLAGILGALLLLGGLAYVYTRSKAQRLFGTLAYRPQDGSQPRRNVRLSRFGKEATLGSQDIPLSGMGETGKLFATKIDGRYHVTVRPETGKRLTFEGKTTVELPLYNGDAFVLEGWEFQYRGPVPRRAKRTGPRRRT